MSNNIAEYLMYLRKSRQDDPNETVEEVLSKHEKILQEYAVRVLGYRIKEENIFREIVSGETLDARPQINVVFKLMENPTTKGVLVVDPQRLTRGDLIDCGQVVHAFRYTNTLVMTPTKTYNLSEKHDRKYFEMELMRGNDYLEYTKEILQRGVELSVSEGNWVSSVAPYGYDRIKVGKRWTLTINEKEAEYVRLAFKWYSEGIGMNTIAHRFTDLGAKPRNSSKEHFSPNTVRNMLDNEVYIGKIVFKKKKTVPIYEDGKLVKKVKRQKDYICVEGKHAPIIDKELFDNVQKIRGSVAPTKVGTELQNIYASLLRCKLCGTAMNYTRYDTCKNVRAPRYQCRSFKYCENVSCNADVVHEAVIKGLKSALKDFEIKVSADNVKIHESYDKIIQGLEKELSDLEVRQEELYEYLEKKIYTQDVFIMRNDKLAKERERLREALDKAKNSMPTIKEYEDKITTLHKTIDMLRDDSIPPLAKNKFLKEIIEVIYYHRPSRSDDIEIEIFLK